MYSMPSCIRIQRLYFSIEITAVHNAYIIIKLRNHPYCSIERKFPRNIPKVLLQALTKLSIYPYSGV